MGGSCREVKHVRPLQLTMEGHNECFGIKVVSLKIMETSCNAMETYELDELCNEEQLFKDF